VTRQASNLTVTAWQDNKVVLVTSTLSDPTNNVTVNRKLKDGSSISITCPESVRDYNRFMGGVDHNDQMRKYHNIRTKSRKVYKYIFWFLFEAAVTNALILCKKYTDLNISSSK